MPLEASINVEMQVSDKQEESRYGEDNKSRRGQWKCLSGMQINARD